MSRLARHAERRGEPVTVARSGRTGRALRDRCPIDDQVLRKPHLDAQQKFCGNTPRETRASRGW
eukprot:4081011-Prymnesium_polylepis.1